MKKAKLVVYDWSDDFVEFFKDRKGRDQVRHTCEEYIKGADLVFAVNNDLYERAGRINTNTYQLANATDYEGISRAVGCNCEAPQSLAGFSKPLLGYIGWITAMRMDTEILKEIAVRHPEWTLVLIGPSGETFRILFQKNKNVVFLPPVDYREMPYYLKVFDVCLIPHKVNEHTRGNNPIKIYDYLAAGKPIVSTPVAGVEALQELIYLAKSPPEFTAMIERALAENTPELQAARMRTAKGNSWTSRIDEAWRLITQHIEAKHPDLKRPANEGETSTKKLKKTAGCHVMR